MYISALADSFETKGAECFNSTLNGQKKESSNGSFLLRFFYDHSVKV
jgi:hypothetical protein